jgi:AraC-like DNA-binding protein
MATSSAYVAAADLRLMPGAEPQVANYPPGATFGPRTLHDFELVWLLHGGATWRCGPRSETLEPGSLLLLRPGMTDTFQWDRRRPTQHAYVHFSLAGADPSGWPLLRHLAPDDVLAALFRHLLSLTPGRQADDVLSLLVAVFVAAPGTVAVRPPAILAAVDYLRSCWAGGRLFPVSLAALAAAASVSTSQLSRHFRAEFGVGPVAAVELLRLGHAEELLLRTNLTVGAIAARCGFADAYHFSRRFRKVYGVPPRHFRAQPARPPQKRLPALQRLLWPLEPGA